MKIYVIDIIGLYSTVYNLHFRTKLDGKQLTERIKRTLQKYFLTSFKVVIKSITRIK